jgi:hypothetical protein
LSVSSTLVALGFIGADRLLEERTGCTEAIFRSPQ